MTTPVTAASIAAAKQAAEAERTAAGLVCDEHGRILHPVMKTA